jgi:hypothetical protein
MHCRSLGMCKRCGDLGIVACPHCKGSGSVRKGGTMLNLGMLDDLYESLGAEARTDNLVPCTKCSSRGRLLCPECSRKPWERQLIVWRSIYKVSICAALFFASITNSLNELGATVALQINLVSWMFIVLTSGDAVIWYNSWNDSVKAANHHSLTMSILFKFNTGTHCFLRMASTRVCVVLGWNQYMMPIVSWFQPSTVRR